MVGLGLTVLAAVAAAGSSTIHIHLWATGYKHLPTIGPLFLMQSISGWLLAVILVVARRSVLVPLAAAGFLVSTAAGMVLSAEVGLFGFKDSFSAPWAKTSLAIELAGALIAMSAAALQWRRQGDIGLSAAVARLRPGRATPTSAAH